jgi:formylglycine-generating enzyme required for sulfatase activity
LHGLLWRRSGAIVCILLTFVIGRFSDLRAADADAPALVVVPFDAVKAKQSQEAWAKQLGVAVEAISSIGTKLSLIPAGEFQMGFETGAPYERPRHKVQITKPYYLGVYEVTQEEFKKVTGRSPSVFSPTGFAKLVEGLNTQRFPVENITWFDAVDFCNRLSEKEKLASFYELSDVKMEGKAIKGASVRILGGEGYRLPTEAEWEFACRGGTETEYFFGNTCDGSQANVDGSNPFGVEAAGPYLKRTTTVGSYPGNAFGLFDMHGNVWEWCQDWYGADYYSKTPVVDPQGPPTGTERVDRGSGSINTASDARSTIRSHRDPSTRILRVGFRVARSPKAKAGS